MINSDDIGKMLLRWFAQGHLNILKYSVNVPRYYVFAESFGFEVRTFTPMGQSGPVVGITARILGVSVMWFAGEHDTFNELLAVIDNARCDQMGIVTAQERIGAELQLTLGRFTFKPPAS